MKIVFIPDTHFERLDPLLSSIYDREKTLNMQLFAVKQLLDHARSLGIHHAIHLGDLFHTASPQQATVARLIAFLSQYPDIHFYFIPGNHDFGNKTYHSQQILSIVGKFIKGSNISVFEQPTSITIEGIPIWFLPFPYLAAPKTPHLCIGHFDINGFKYNNGVTVVANKCDPRHLGNDNYWVIGHNHLFQRSRNVIYPGTLYQINFNESPNKGFLKLRVEFKGKLTVNPSWTPILKPVYTLKQLYYTKLEDLAQVTNKSNEFWQIHSKKNSPPIPNNWLVEHPNVVNFRPAAVTKSESTITSVDIAEKSISPLWGLREWLVHAKLSPEQVNEGMALVAKLIQ